MVYISKFSAIVAGTVGVKVFELVCKRSVQCTKDSSGCRMIYAALPSFFGLGLEDGHVPTRRASTANAWAAEGLLNRCFWAV